jgi:hypothetical protein
MLNRIFPKQFDNDYQGLRPAIWLLIAFVAVKLVIGVNTIFNTQSVATGGDGLTVDSMSASGAQTVLMMMTLVSLCQLILAAQSIIVLVRYRAMIPFMYLVLLSEHLLRRALILRADVARTEETPVGAYINLGLLAVLILGFLLSLVRARKSSERP